MSEIYWLTRLDSIVVFLWVIIVLSIAISIASILCYCMDDMCDSEEERIRHKKVSKISLIVLIVSSILCVFTPTTKDAYIIYGVGGTLDYIKQNDKVKQLPDKCVIALDKWVDEYINEEGTQENKK